VLVTRSGDDRLATTHGICPDCIAALRAAGLSH
jgi:hypothetical protein